MSDELNCGEELLGTPGLPWWPAQGGATSDALGHLGCKGSVLAERSGEGGDGGREMAGAGREADSWEHGGLWDER